MLTPKAKSVEVTIRRAAFADLPAIESLLAQQWEVGELTPERRRSVYDKWCKADKIVLVAVLSGDIVGTASACIDHKLLHGGGRAFQVEDVIVHRDARKHGIGRRLMQEIVSYAKKHGAYKVVLDCHQDVAAFYEKCGFLPSGVQMRKDV